ncbi:Inner membrane protein yedI [Providencia rustigianii]|nr:Inner membrane protein yedI [Providencia rustigianii]
MKTLSVVGTAAMFMVGGGILTHGISYLHSWIEKVAEMSAMTPAIGAILQFLMPSILNLVFGLVIGLIIVLIFSVFAHFKKAKPSLK